MSFDFWYKSGSWNNYLNFKCIWSQLFDYTSLRGDNAKQQTLLILIRSRVPLPSRTLIQSSASCEKTACRCGMQKDVVDLGVFVLQYLWEIKRWHFCHSRDQTKFVNTCMYEANLKKQYKSSLCKGGFPVLARSSSLRVHAWALSSNHNAKR
jgi:hypothetical protein